MWIIKKESRARRKLRAGFFFVELDIIIVNDIINLQKSELRVSVLRVSFLRVGLL